MWFYLLTVPFKGVETRDAIHSRWSGDRTQEIHSLAACNMIKVPKREVAKWKSSFRLQRSFPLQSAESTRDWRDSMRIRTSQMKERSTQWR